jgi:murein L,D-transpeptidase YcbB/YkuD
MIKTILIAFLAFNCFEPDIFAQQNIVGADSMVMKFYTEAHKSLYWFPPDDGWLSSIKNWFSGNGIGRAKQWLIAIESAESFGLIANKEQISQLRAILSSKTKIDFMTKAKTDTLITDVVLHFIKDLEQGNSRFDYDAISVNRDSLYILQLLRHRSLSSVSKVIASLDCKDHDYKVYKKFLRDSVSATDSLRRKTLSLAMNYRRFLSINCQSEFILVNIAQTEAEYFKSGKLAITMRTVVGKKTKQTPTIASYIASITTFPYWNVPHQIAVDEILPKVQKNENYLEQNSYDVVDANGNELDDSDLHWNDFTERNFPYFFRQSSGSENALGVVKFDLQDPFSIFLHGTSNQKTFSKDFRFLSHGCIRLEKPFDLADSLLRGKLDMKELETGKTDKKPGIMALPDKIPTFIIYMPIKIDGEKVTFLKDEYQSI